jgi:hypothetical protein
MIVAFFESRWFWVVFGVLTYTAALLTVWLVAVYPFVGAATFAEIELGMTVTEVEELLGGPPGDYRSFVKLDVGSLKMHPTNIAVAGAAGWKEWLCDEGRIWIWFDPEERVVFKHFVAPGP